MGHSTKPSDIGPAIITSPIAARYSQPSLQKVKRILTLLFTFTLHIRTGFQSEEHTLFLSHSEHILHHIGASLLSLRPSVLSGTRTRGRTFADRHHPFQKSRQITRQPPRDIPPCCSSSGLNLVLHLKGSPGDCPTLGKRFLGIWRGALVHPTDSGQRQTQSRTRLN